MMDDTRYCPECGERALYNAHASSRWQCWNDECATVFRFGHNHRSVPIPEPGATWDHEQATVPVWEWLSFMTMYEHAGHLDRPLRIDADREGVVP